MCTEPELLCLDEPAAGLNPRESARAERAAARHPRRARHLDPADRARHVGGDARSPTASSCSTTASKIADGTPAADPQRPEGDRGLSRRRGRRGRARSRRSRAVSTALAPRDRSSARGLRPCARRSRASISTSTPGEIVTLIGANGAGKSTLMMTIFGDPRARTGRSCSTASDITGDADARDRAAAASPSRRKAGGSSRA